MVVRAARAVSVLLACLGCSALFTTGCDSGSDDAADKQEAASEKDSGAPSVPDQTKPDAATSATDPTSSSPDAATSTTDTAGNEPDAASTATDTTSSSDGGTSKTDPSADIDAATADAAKGEVCWLEYLGDWGRCETVEDLVLLDMPGASSDECAAACIADPECASVVDYSWYAVEGLGCFLNLGICEDPTQDALNAYDGAFEYRKRCGEKPPAGALYHLATEPGVRVTPESDCFFKAIDVVCENADESDASASTGATLAECFAQCDAREDCSAVAYYMQSFDGDAPAAVCSLHLSTCDAGTEPTDLVRYHKKFCGGVADAGN